MPWLRFGSEAAVSVFSPLALVSVLLGPVLAFRVLRGCLDRCLRKTIASAVFKNWPSSRDTTDWLDVVVQSIGHKPKYIIIDQGPQFDEGYEDWCNTRGTKSRFGAVGQHGAIAVVERFILSLKNECTRRIVAPLRIDEFRWELANYFCWYNKVRPHQSLGAE